MESVRKEVFFFMQSVQTNCCKEGVAYVLATIRGVRELHASCPQPYSLFMNLRFFCIESAQTADATEGVGHVL